MKTIVTFQVCLIVFLATFYQEEVSGQSLYPAYGGPPIIYDNSDDDDIGLLLTVLLLASRGRNNNCCNCCNCGNSARSVPVPYPIPFPTNNPIINKPPPYYPNDEDYYNGEGEEDNNGKNVDYKDSWSSGKFKSDAELKKNLSLKYVPVPLDDDS